MGQYDSWLTEQVYYLIQAIQSGSSPDQIATYVAEIQRGIYYAGQNPGQIMPLLVRMAEGIIGPVIVDYGLQKKSSSGQEGINVDELKEALGQHKKDKVMRRMSGSLRSLEEFDSDDV